MNEQINMKSEKYKRTLPEPQSVWTTIVNSFKPDTTKPVTLSRKAKFLNFIRYIVCVIVFVLLQVLAWKGIMATEIDSMFDPRAIFGWAVIYLSVEIYSRRSEKN